MLYLFIFAWYNNFNVTEGVLNFYIITNRIPDKMPQIRHGQNATKRKPDKMPLNNNASKL